VRLSNKRIAVFVEEGFEDLEFWVTVMRLREEGARVTIVGVKANHTVKSKNGGLTAPPVRSPPTWRADDFERRRAGRLGARQAAALSVSHRAGAPGLRRQDRRADLPCRAGGNLCRHHCATRATAGLGIKDDWSTPGQRGWTNPRSAMATVWGRVVEDILTFAVSWSRQLRQDRETPRPGYTGAWENRCLGGRIERNGPSFATCAWTTFWARALRVPWRKQSTWDWTPTVRGYPPGLPGPTATERTSFVA
jgi:protease I